MSEQLRADLAREMGVAEVVSREGWGAVSSRTCGSLVRAALIRAQRQISGSPAPVPPEAPRPQ
ncbi:MAG: hypothetical protein RDU89_09945 [bacterium]|nr:hypothetical protein [bacterium]